MVCLTFACSQNIHAMRCGIKSLTQPRKTREFKALSFCSKSEKSHDDLKQLQRIYKSLPSNNPNCFEVVTKKKSCKYGDNCCMLAKESIEKAEKGKALRLQKENHVDGQVYIEMLRGIEKKLTSLLRKHVDAQSVVLESSDKESLESHHKAIKERITMMAECLIYSANIYGMNFYDCSAQYYKENPKGLFDSTKHMTPEDRERENLQNECNETYKSLMLGIGIPRNKNILMGWGKNMMDPYYIFDWLDAIQSAMRDHDDYRKNGGSVY